VLSILFKILFDSGEVLEPFFFLLVKIDVVDDVVEVSGAGIDDSSVERRLLLYWKPCRILKAEIRVGTRSFIFFVDETFFEEENNPWRSSLSQKFSFQASFFKWRQNLLLYHMYHFWSRWWEQSRPEPYLFLSTSIFAGQNDQLRLKSSKTLLKAFQLIFPWLKMKWKTLYISNLDSWVDQKKHLNKDAQKNVME